MPKKIIIGLLIVILFTAGYLFLPALIAYTKNVAITSMPALPVSTSSPTPAPSIPDAQFYKNLIETYNNNTTRVLEIAKWVVLIVGALSGGGGVYFYVSNNNRISEVDRSVEAITKDLKVLSSQSGDLQNHIKTTKDEIEKFQNQLKELSSLTENAQNNIKTMREDTFRQQVFVNLKSPNASLRLRSVQKFGYESCDDTIVSALVERLQTDRASSVRVEASASVGQVLCSEIRNGGTEQPIFQYGLSALLKALNSKDGDVKAEAFRALLNIREVGYLFSKVDLKV